ncbi:MAG: glycosyltransferase family 2 protein [Lachnospiraceae bacterium]|nr:glycosyltransferase family 2 protein [Lachnospiraceae bacterium]
MPVYNASKTLAQAVESVYAQQVPVEMYLIDDGSTDDPKGVLAPYLDLPDFHFLQNETNMGVAKTRMRGVEEAKTKYIAFLDADDWWEEGKLQEQLAAMEESGATLSSTGRELMRPDGSSMGRTIAIPEKIDEKTILRSNYLNCSGVMVTRSAMLAFPMQYDDSHEDYISWINMIKAYGPALGINKPYLKYRLSDKSKSGSKLHSAAMNYKVYRYCGYGVLKSLLLNLSYMWNGVRKYYFK